jgi:Peptidase family M28/PA domain
MRLLAALIVVAVAAIALVVAGGDDGKHGDDRPAASQRQQQTPTATPQASIEPQGISEHLKALAAAAKPDNTRAAGTAGDRRTARYIAQRLKAAGYRVTEQAFKVPVFHEREPARVSGLRRGRDFLTLTYSGSGRATGNVQRVGLACNSAPGLQGGEIAVAERGVCTFSEKAQQVQRHGASALLVVSDSGAPFAGSLIGPVRIPVLAVSTRAGRDLSGRVTVAVDADSGRRTTRNVVAEIGPAGADRVFMAGAHLDSVIPGPGINDNGSGVAAILEVAEQLAGDQLPPDTAIRVGFWAAEEIGLVGSRRYVNSLSRAQRRRIRAYINLDMVGSPGETIAVYIGVRPAGRAIEKALRADLPNGTREEDLGDASDHASFERAGIPIGGLFTGLDRCYHRACDRLGNADAKLAAKAARTTADALLGLAGR